jgi:hypothetical protein
MKHMTVITTEQALDLIYQGQTNVAVIAKEIDVPFEEMKRLFKDYVAQRPYDPAAWEQEDLELSWPWC